jgi:hypothetical protein
MVERIDERRRIVFWRRSTPAGDPSAGKRSASNYRLQEL